jgi:hypothetical protein
LQRFDPAEAVAAPNPDAGKLQAALSALWEKTEPAGPDEEGSNA